MTELMLRTVAHSDEPFLHAMLYEAAFWRPGTSPRPPVEEAVRLPDLRVYVERWGRSGDHGIIATAGTQPLGAAWYRLFSKAEHGYGFVDEDIPELAIAVVRAHRGKGVGRALLAALLVQARLDGFDALSLSVEEDNPARALYVRFGFVPVPQSGAGHVMVVELASGRDLER